MKIKKIYFRQRAILIESQWNLNKFMREHGWDMDDYINRITVEFKLQVDREQIGVKEILIESQWNLNFCLPNCT